MVKFIKRFRLLLTLGFVILLQGFLWQTHYKVDASELESILMLGFMTIVVVGMVVVIIIDIRKNKQ